MGGVILRDFKLDDTGDIVIENGSIIWVEGDELIAQQVAFVLSNAKGEWFLNPDLYLDREPFMVKNYDESRIRDAIIECVSQVEAVNTVEDIELERIERTLFIRLTVTKQDNTTIQGIEVAV